MLILNKHCHHVLIVLKNPGFRLEISQSIQQLAHSQGFPVMQIKGFLQTLPLSYPVNATGFLGGNQHGRIESLRGKESYSSPAVPSLSSAESLFQQGFHSSLSADLCPYQNSTIQPTKIFHSRTSLRTKTSAPFSTNIGDSSAGEALKLSPVTQSHLPAGLLLYLTALCYTPNLIPPSQKKLLALCEDAGFLLATVFEEIVWWSLGCYLATWL